MIVSTKENREQQQYIILGGVAEVTATIKDLKVVILMIPPFNSPVWPMQQTDLGGWEQITKN